METLKVLMLNGSPRPNGNTAVALREIETVFRENGVEVETVIIGNRAIRGCVACGGCAKTGKCVFDDAVNELAPKFEAADGLVVASPVYYASANATLVACLDRLFYSTPFDKTMKVGASVVCARGAAAPPPLRAEQILHHFPGCGGLQSVLEQYPRPYPGEAEADGEGRPDMRTLARNMTFLMRSIALGKEHFGLPEQEARIATHFIR